MRRPAKHSAALLRSKKFTAGTGDLPLEAAPAATKLSCRQTSRKPWPPTKEAAHCKGRSDALSSPSAIASR